MRNSLFRRLLNVNQGKCARKARRARVSYGRLAVEGLEDRLVPAPVLTLNPIPATVPEGPTAVNFKLGTLTDTAVATTGFLAAQVDWGDGTPGNPDITAVTLTQTGAHTWSINGSHAYTDGGSFLVTVTAIDVFSFTSPTIQTTTINVTDPDLKVTAMPIQVGENQSFSGQVATISDPGSTDVFTALINWGDGTITVGTLTGSNGNFAVNGSHTYADDGIYSVTVTAVESGLFQANLNGANQMPPTASAGTGTVTLVLHPNATITIMGNAQNLSTITVAHVHIGPPGTTGPVATDVNGMNIEYTAGQTGPSATFPPQNFTVNSSFIASLVEGNVYTNIHTVAFPGGEIRGQFNALFTESATGATTATVAETDLTGGVNNFFLAGTNIPFTPASGNLFKTTVPEGQALTTNIAEVYDGFLAIPTGNATASIHWGDGTTTTGMVSTPPLLNVPGGGLAPFSGDIISGTHTYADEGVYTITVIFSETDNNGNPLPGGTITFTATETVTDADTLAPAAGVTQPTIGTAAQPLMVGTAFSGAVGVFSDVGYPGQTRADLQATINWGDGSFGNGTITKDPNTGLFTVGGKHTYTTPGTFPVTVTLSDDPEGVAENPPGVVHAIATISNGQATLSVSPILAPERAQATLTATLTDPNAINAGTGLPNPANAYTASVNWGDGTTSAGTVSGPNGGPYTISGSHTYAVDGTYTVTVSVIEPGVLPVPLATGTATATVADDGIFVTATPVAATEGTAFTGTTATFTDPGAVQVLNPVPSNGDVNPYGLAVVPPSFPNTGVLQPGDILVANFNNAGNIQGTGTTISRINAAGQTSTFFTSTVPGLSTALGVLKAGFVIVGNVPNDGAGNVLPGSLQVLDNNGNLVETIVSPALLADPWDLTVNDQGTTAQVFVSNVVTGTVSRIDLTIPAGGVPAVQDAAQIASGYRTRLDAAAFVVGPGGLAYDQATDTLYVASQAELVNGVEVGSIYAIANAGTTTTDNGTGTLIYADPAHLHGPIGLVLLPSGDLVTANSDAVNADPNQPSELVEFTTTGQFVGQFSMDPNTGGAFGIAMGTIGGISKLIAVDDNNASVTAFNFVPTSAAVNAFSASINWGDGTTSAGTVTFSGNGTPGAAGGTFTVTGTHTYADEGPETTSVLVTENGVAEAFFTFLSGANQVPPVPTPGNGISTVILSADQTTLTLSTQFFGLTSNPTAAHLHNAAAGANGPVALDANGNNIELANLPSATGGSVGPQAFMVTPAFLSQFFQGNIYENVHTVNNPAGEIRGQFLPPTVNSSAATVAEADTFANLAVVANPVTEGMGTPQVVATFSDPGYPTQVAGDVSATIDWGDGTAVTSGTVAATGNGNFAVTGGHAYAAPGSYTVKVTVNDDAPGTATASATGTITVNSVAALTVTALPVTGTEASPFSGPVATFTTPNMLATASMFSASILWGDLNQSPPPPVTITGGNGTFTVSSSHTYLSEGPFTFTVNVSENAPGTATGKATGTATMADADTFNVTVTPPTGALAGTPLNNVQVAAFSDAGYASNVAADMSATIAWGDGSSSGKITPLGGGMFQVTGSHTYSMGGSFMLAVTIKDIDGTATGTGTGTIAVQPSVIPSPTITSLTETNHVVNGQGFGVTGQTLNFTSTFTGAAGEIPHKATFNWGDNTSSAGTVGESGTPGSPTINGTVTASHVYTAYGIYTVTETVTNKDGAAATATFTVNIVPFDLQPLAVDPKTGQAPAAAGTLQLVVGGSMGNDHIDVHVNYDQGHKQYKYNVHVQNFQTQGDVVAPAPIGLIIVYGQNGNNQIHVNSDGKISVPSWIFTGSGNDNIHVDHGNNMIVAGGGQNQIQGGDGRDFIIGGSGGGAQLKAGNGGDLVVAGSTAYDHNIQALARINAEWDSGDPFYLKVARLIGAQGGGLNGANVLNASTVTHANGSDNVQGGNGPDLVFARANGANADKIQVKNGVVFPI